MPRLLVVYVLCLLLCASGCGCASAFACKTNRWNTHTHIYTQAYTWIDIELSLGLRCRSSSLIAACWVSSSKLQLQIACYWHNGLKIWMWNRIWIWIGIRIWIGITSRSRTRSRILFGRWGPSSAINADKVSERLNEAFIFMMSANPLAHHPQAVFSFVINAS